MRLKTELDKKERRLYLALILATFIVYIAVVVVTVIGTGDGNGNPLIFNNTIQGVADMFTLDITPPDWLFVSVWPAIFIYLLLWIIYALTLICRRPGDRKGFLYFRPPFMPRLLYLTFIISIVFVAGWVYAFTAERLVLSFFALLIVAIFAVAALGFAAYGLREYGCDLIRVGNRKDVAFDRLLVQNGLGLYAGWVTFAMLLNLAIALIEEWDVGEEDAQTIALAIFLFLLAVYFILDIIVFRIAFRFIFSPYVISTITLAAIISNDWDIEERNCLLALFSLGFAGFVTFFKLVTMVYLLAYESEPLVDNCTKHKDELSVDSSGLDTDEEEDSVRYMKQAKILLSQ